MPRSCLSTLLVYILFFWPNSLNHTITENSHVCACTRTGTYSHVCTSMHIHLPGTDISSLQPLKRGGKEAECYISLLSKQAISFFAQSGMGVVGSHDWPWEGAPLAHISQTPQTELLSRTLSNFLLTAGPDLPTKKGIVSPSTPWASALQRSAGGLREGICGDEGTASCATNLRRVTNS